MARYDKALWRPLPENNSEPGITPTQLIFHTAACRCGDSLYDDFNRPGNNLESHFNVWNTGVVEQYVDTARQADANYHANVRAISVETQDDGQWTEPWTDQQADALVELAVWAIRTHPDIKPRVCPEWDTPGLGHHTLFGAPSHWTPVAKSCPGPARKGQFPEIVRRVQERLAPKPVQPPAPTSAILDDDMFIAYIDNGPAYLMAANTKVLIHGSEIDRLKSIMPVILAPELISRTPDA